MKTDLTCTTPEVLSAHRMVALHLLPGMLMLTAMLIAGPLAELLKLPADLTQVIFACFTIGIPLQLGYLLYLGKKRNHQLSLRGILLYQKSMPLQQYVLYIVLILAWLAIIWLIIRPPVNEFFIRHFFTWMPSRFFESNLQNVLPLFPKTTMLVIGILFTVCISLGGAVEELYFRGYLLPRMSNLKKWAPLVEMLLFSLYHFWSPWENIPRILAMIPLYYIVWWKQNLRLAVLVHFFINLVSGLSLVFMIASSPYP